MLVFLCVRRRREQEREEAQRVTRLLQLQQQAKLASPAANATYSPSANTPQHVEIDIEAIADSPSRISPKFTEQESSISRLAFEAPSPIIPPEFVEKRRQEDKEARARRAARRSVFSVLTAMSELDEAFMNVDKEMQMNDDTSTNVVTVPVEEEEVDLENQRPVSSNLRNHVSPSKQKKQVRSELKQLEVKEAKKLVMEVKAQKLNQAISKLEHAIGNLERKIDHEKVKQVADPALDTTSDQLMDTSGVLRSSGKKVSFSSFVSDGDDINNTTMLNATSDTFVGDDSHLLNTSHSYIISRSSRGAPVN